MLIAWNALTKGTQEKQAGDEYTDRHPEMYIGQDVRKRALARRAFVGHAALSEEKRRYAKTKQVFIQWSGVADPGAQRCCLPTGRSSGARRRR
jgi:hypothetical protein